MLNERLSDIIYNNTTNSYLIPVSFLSIIYVTIYVK